MHDPGKHSSPVRLPFGSFPAINILLSHTDIVLQTNRAACTLFRLLSCVAGKLCKLGKYQTMTVNRITSRNADHVYTVFFQRTFFLSGYFRERKEKRIFVLRQTKKVLSFFFPGGCSCNTRFFLYLERTFAGLWEAPAASCNLCFLITLQRYIIFFNPQISTQISLLI